jgi:YD repeat-containing protein
VLVQPVSNGSAPGAWKWYTLRQPLASGSTLTLQMSSGSSALQLDELRLHPVGAQMTSYSYDPLRGLTSQTDASGRTITYEYDTLGRFLRTRDEQGRLLTQQQYHYARP